MLIVPVTSCYTGCGDFFLSSVSVLSDPCPLPDKTKKRSLNEKEKLIFAPMSGVGGIVYDKVRNICPLIRCGGVVYDKVRNICPPR